MHLCFLRARAVQVKWARKNFEAALTGNTGGGEGGFFTVIAVFILTVALSIFPEFSAQFRLLTPIEQALTRAGNGFALMVLLVVGLWRFHGVPAAFGDWGPLVCLGLLVYGLFRFIVGARQCWGLRDTMLASRGFMKFLFGVVGAWLLWPNQRADIVVNNGVWAWFAWLCLFCVSLWWAATGAVRFVLMLGLRRQRKAPPPFKMPHGVGGDATAAQARAAMRGQGGQRSRFRRAYRLDVRHFMATLAITGHEELRQVDHRAVIAWERHMREVERDAPSTIRRRLSALSAC